MSKFLHFPRGRLAVLLAAALLAGCDVGPGRQTLSGAITHGGEPVPAGHITFSPRGDAPATVADIADGRYRTRSGKGIVPGEYDVRVVGTDKTMATETHDNSLFPPYDLTMTVSAGAGSIDIDVPKLP